MTARISAHATIQGMFAELLGGAAFTAAGVLAWGVRGRSSKLLAPSIWRGPTHRPAIALTFDDGPSESTPLLLELLAAHSARATFFECGANARRLPAIAREVLAAGHEIGNHTETHAPLYFRQAAFIRDEVGQAQDSIASVTGTAPSLFRAPFGARWFGLRSVQAEFGLLGVMWSAIARDWTLSAPAISARLEGRAGPGAIICLHDGRVLQRQPDISSTLSALRELLPRWRDDDIEFLTVSDLLCLKKPSLA